MAQSYKVFIGGSVICFRNEATDAVVFNKRLTNPSPTDWPTLIQEFEVTEYACQVDGNVEENWKNFRTNYTIVEAAGGLVQNADGYWLFIYRNGMWDLPKGKLEQEESIEQCAVREVAEECGITEPTIIRKLTTTYHTYTLGDQRILKPSHWFLMKSTDESALTPQTEEGITAVRWVSSKEAIELAKDSFGSIRAVVHEGLT